MLFLNHMFELKSVQVTVYIVMVLGIMYTLLKRLRKTSSYRAGAADCFLIYTYIGNSTQILFHSASEYKL
jgi:hypothetical protein